MEETEALQGAGNLGSNQDYNESGLPSLWIVFLFPPVLFPPWFPQPLFEAYFLLIFLPKEGTKICAVSMMRQALFYAIYIHAGYILIRIL